MPDPRLPYPVHRLLYLLGGNQASVRLEIVTCLARVPEDVSSLARNLDLDVKTVSSHLRTLRDHGIVEVTPRKQRRVYHLSGDVLVESRNGSVTLRMNAEDGSEIRIALNRGPTRPRPKDEAEE